MNNTKRVMDISSMFNEGAGNRDKARVLWNDARFSAAIMRGAFWGALLARNQGNKKIHQECRNMAVEQAGTACARALQAGVYAARAVLKI